jgi:hypothetical protein
LVRLAIPSGSGHGASRPDALRGSTSIDENHAVASVIPAGWILANFAAKAIRLA